MSQDGGEGTGNCFTAFQLEARLRVGLWSYGAIFADGAGYIHFQPNRRMKTKFPFTIALISTVLLSGVCLAEPPADNSPEKAAVVANDKAYEAAYAKADVKAMVDFFSEDAEYTSEDGRVFTGRAEIEQAIRQGLLANRGAKLAIEVSSVRVLGPDGGEIARGISAYTSSETQAILGSPSSDIERRLGYTGPDELIHRDDLVLM